jgi:DNA-binding response OmpR family regulator
MTRVLLVDDDEMSRDMLSRRLIRRGFEVIFAVDGKQGASDCRWLRTTRWRGCAAPLTRGTA